MHPTAIVGLFHRIITGSSMRSVFFIVFLMLAVPAFAVDDLPLYLDAGCPGTGIPKSYAKGPAGMEIATIDGNSAIPITCTDAYNGTDAAILHTSAKLQGGEFYDIIFKFADDRGHSINQHKDLRLRIKNRNATPAKFKIAFENANYSTGTYHTMEIPGGGDWNEYVIALAGLGSDSVVGLKLSNPTVENNGPDTDADPVNILIDSITITDGTNNGSIAIPPAVWNKRPDGWTNSFLVGSFDNRELGKSTAAAQGGCPYRYQYMMPETKEYYSSSGKGYLYDYATESANLGVKTAIVWYNLGKSGEGFGPVAENLASATYMTDYIDRYEWVLDQLALAGQSDYMIVIEPDMYGFIMRGEMYHPADITVNMSRANEVTGKIYASTMVGWAEYLVGRAREKLPNGVIIGHMPNHWGVNIPGQVGQGPKEAHIMSGLTIGQFIKELGPEGMGDVVFVEKTDHDAGHKPVNENWMWDSAGYAKYFLWTRSIAVRTGLPIVGWQVSEGNTGNPAAQKDNTVETFLAHPRRWYDGGFIGILFGAGNGDCCNYLEDTDGGWFVQKMTAYNANPWEFPTTVAVHPTGNTPIVSSRQNSLNTLISGNRLFLSGWEGSARVSLFSIDGRLIDTAGSVVSGESMCLANGIRPGTYLAVADIGRESLWRSFVVSGR
jgi:hypothetical protein